MEADGGEKDFYQVDLEEGNNCLATDSLLSMENNGRRMAVDSGIGKKHPYYLPMPYQ